MQTLKEMTLEALDKMAKGHPADKSSGICYNLGLMTNIRNLPFRLTKEELQGFKHWSGSTEFPIAREGFPTGNKAYADALFDPRRNALWTGDYGRRRKMFARYWAQCLRRRDSV